MHSPQRGPRDRPPHLAQPWQARETGGRSEADELLGLAEFSETDDSLTLHGP